MNEGNRVVIALLVGFVIGFVVGVYAFFAPMLGL